MLIPLDHTSPFKVILHLFCRCEFISQPNDLCVDFYPYFPTNAEAVSTTVYQLCDIPNSETYRKRHLLYSTKIITAISLKKKCERQYNASTGNEKHWWPALRFVYCIFHLKNKHTHLVFRTLEVPLQNWTRYLWR